MGSVTVRVPDELEARLRMAAGNVRGGVSRVVVAALRAALDGSTASVAATAPNIIVASRSAAVPVATRSDVVCPSCGQKRLRRFGMLICSKCG